MTASPPVSPDAPRSLLVRGVNWLGDAVMTTPALQRLRERFPGTRMVLLTPEKLADLWRHHPCVDAVLAVPAGESLWRTSQRLRREHCEVALVLPNSPRSALEVWLAGIPRRVGYARPWRNWFLSQRVAARAGVARMRKLSNAEIHRRIQEGAGAAPSSYPSGSHQVYEYLHLAGALGAGAAPLPPLLVVTPEEVDAARERFSLPSGGLLLGLNPGAEYGPAKRWPVERFAAAAREIQARTQCAWLLFGGKADAGAAERLQAALASAGSPAVLNLAGKTSLRELLALLRQCRVLLTNDTGPMHVAAALGTPVVVPFGSTSPELTGPGLPGDAGQYLLKSGVPCSPCFRRECPVVFRCMEDIAVERVVTAVLEAASLPARP